MINAHYRLKAIGFIAALMVTASTAVAPSGADTGTPPRTGRINIYGNRITKSYVIRRVIPLRPGDPYDRARVDLARERIGQIAGIDYSDIRVSYSLEDSTLSLDVAVTEKSAYQGYPVVQRGLENLFSFGAYAANENFRGRNETIGASALFGGGTVVNVMWENPWLGEGPRIGIGLSGKYRNYKYVYDDLEGIFEGAGITQYGGEFSLFYTFWSGFRIIAGAGYAVTDGDEEGVTIEPGGDRFPLYSLGLHYDSRDSHAWTWSGWYLKAKATAVGPGEEAYSILQGRLDARVFIPVFDRTVLALQVRPQVNDGDRVPVYMREHIGGGMTLRSWDYGEFNAASSMLTSAEFRLPVNFGRRDSIGDKLFAMSIHVFADAGAVWELDQSASDAELWHGGYGIGVVLLNSWFRGLRFDYGWHEGSDGRAHFEIGTKF
jgi:outer membrane protein assembly factor BamA